MAKIKVVSNPYNQCINYYTMINDEWVEINYEDNANSELLSDDMVNGFFPFHVKEMVEIIEREYKDEEDKIKIVFEGTDDEFFDLVSVCAEDDNPDRFEVERSNRRLANARDVLPSITQIFTEKLSPLIVKSIDEDKIKEELKKFTDASKDTVPICILGNYSAGKSTFINSLIGNELLPCGDEPITAKIYQISKSPSSYRAYIELEYESEKFKILFNEKHNEIIYTGGTKPLYNMIKDKLDELGEVRIINRMHEALEIINDFDKNDSPDAISNLISIQVPFVGGLLEQSDKDFVIFDTPGSNSASNDKHLEVLQEQINGLSNGLPIFVSEYDSLDSTDNERLYNVIREVKELDSRFTMIVVNKADSARLPKGGFSEEEVDQIRGMAVPKNLYTEGIYFASSIIGLGAKNDADFIDDHCAEIFEGEERKYSDTSSRFYKSLYKYNIMPTQLRKRAMEKAEERTDLLYANSGLFSVEDEILTFAEKYSHYNKCKQACLFLDKVIDNTTNEIIITKNEREEQRTNVTESFEQDKKELVESIENSSKELEAEGKNLYEIHMENVVNEAAVVYTEDEIESLEEEFTQKQKDEKNYDDHQVDYLKSKLHLSNNLKENIGKVFKKRSLDALRELSSDFKDDLNSLNTNSDKLTEVQHSVDKTASDELLDKVKNEFTNHITEAQGLIEKASFDYWQEKADEIRQKLIELVTGSDVLSDENKADLKDIILSYEDVNLEDIADDTFIRDDFERGLWFGKIKIISSDKLNIKKLVGKYNAKMDEIVDDLYEKVKTTHENNLNSWLEKLLDTVIDNIDEYNPELKEQKENIKEISERIEELEKRQADITMYSKQIRSMLEWSEV